MTLWLRRGQLERMAVVAARNLHTVRVPEGVMHQCQSIDIRLRQHPSRLDFNQLHHRGPVASLPRGARNETIEEVAIDFDPEPAIRRGLVIIWTAFPAQQIARSKDD